ncbi:arylamine N-acetyltransferase family protein [Paremcibacter congregatus]|uniref:Arylamine N-acetyltransferase n=1 Tax=Paremcibacter congregatus TaxID=2043170 RepID=A0A2G4YTR4_9PROT|nr:arylamine N-acetyltransferase [Paremcibacter congregatus]PHZ85687.1 hypothetical protein CRD36_03085 [Paremcibacter congregatus]QDE26647.1 arylamine N-acetyltransferase [Paremcibacter congregatus]
MKTTTQTYLNGLDITLGPDQLTFLQNITAKHLSAYSFNNLAILLDPTGILSLNLDDLTHKIVTQGRGGYCFEHNKLLFDVLQDLGFEVRAKLARVVYGRDADVPRSHRVTLVTLAAETYLVDVGFGAYTPLVPMPLSGAEVTCVNGARYRVKALKQGEYQLEIVKDGAYFTLYHFDEGSYTESDFVVANYYTNCHPESKFVRELVMSRITKRETFLILQAMFSRITPAGRTDHVIADGQDLQRILKAYFDLDLESVDCDRLFSKTLVSLS